MVMADANPQTQTQPGAERSTADLMRDLSNQTTALVRKEVELAKVELEAKGRTAAAGAGMFGGAGLFGLFAFGALTACLMLALATFLEPWIAAGTFAEELAAGDGSVQASVLATDRSRLLLITQHSPAQQFVLGPPPRDSLQVTVPGVSISDKAYRVSAAGVKLLRISHSGTGANINIDDASLATAVVITQDPLAIHHLGRTLAEIQQEAGRLRYDVAVRRLVQTIEIDRELNTAQRPRPSHDSRACSPLLNVTSTSTGNWPASSRRTTTVVRNCPSVFVSWNVNP